MYELYVIDHGEEMFLTKGTLDWIIKYLRENTELYDWVLAEDPMIDLPDMDKVEDLYDLELELRGVDLGWFTLEVRDVEE